MFGGNEMSYFVDAAAREFLELAPGARTRTFWGNQMLFSLVEVDANSEVPLHTPVSYTHLTLPTIREV